MHWQRSGALLPHGQHTKQAKLRRPAAGLLCVAAGPLWESATGRPLPPPPRFVVQRELPPGTYQFKFIVVSRVGMVGSLR